MKARNTTLVALLLTLLPAASIPATGHPGRTADEQRVLRGIVKLPHEREQAVMQKLGVVSTEGFRNCLCRRAGYGSSSTSQFWHPGTIGKYDPRYSCNRPGDPCVVSGFGCSRHPAPSDLAVYEGCAQAYPGEDGENLLDQALRSIRPQSDKRVDDYRRELAACRERNRLERELRYLGGDRKAGYDYLKKKKVPLLKPPEHLRKRLNADAERIRVERVKAARRAEAKLRDALSQPSAAVRRLASAPPAGIKQWWSLGWLGDGSAVTVHDMQRLGVIGLDGRAPEWVPLVDMIGERGQMLSSSDRVLASPSDPTVFAYTRMVPGTARFESAMHEPNTAPFLHDRFLGRGKNLRLSAEDMTVVDVGWAPDGRSLYLSGYPDRHLREHDPFRVYRIGRDGRGLTELGRGERVSGGCRPGPTGGAR